MNGRLVIAALCGGLLTFAVPVRVPAQDTAATESAKFSADRLDQLVGPIALYPDPVLIQVRMASTTRSRSSRWTAGVARTRS